MHLPDTYSAVYADQLLSAIAASADTKYRRTVVDALQVSARDISNALLWRGVIRRACGAGRLPPAIADYLMMRCASEATKTVMAADHDRLNEEIEEINRRYCPDAGGYIAQLSPEAQEEWDARIAEVEVRREERSNEVEIALLREWGERELAGWMAADIDRYCDQDEKGAEMLYGEPRSDNPVGLWVAEPGA